MFRGLMKGLIYIAHAEHAIQTTDLKSNLSFNFHHICIKTFETAIPSRPKINNDVFSLRSDFDVSFISNSPWANYILRHSEAISMLLFTANYIY